MEEYKVRRNILILTDSHRDNSGIKQLVDRMEEKYTDYQTIVIDEKQYTGMWWAKSQHYISKQFLQQMPRFTHKLIFKKGSIKIKEIRGNISEKNIIMREYRCVYNAIIRYVPDVVVVTSHKTLIYAAVAKRKGALSNKVISLMPTFSVNLDYYDHRIDGYIVENSGIKTSLTEMGVHEEKITVLGLPFEEKKYIIKEIIETKESLGLNFCPTVLLSGGRFGNREMLEVFKLLLDQGDYINVLCYCGGNGNMFNKIVRLKDLSKADNVKVYTEGANLTDLLTASDMVITSYDVPLIYRSLLRELPVITYSPDFSAEENDFKYLENKGLSYYAKDYNETIIGMYKMIQQNLGAGFKQKIKECINKHSLIDICDFLTKTDDKKLEK
jgi:hypothetical protein